MDNHLGAALAYLEREQGRYLEELKDFVRIPSVSTDSGLKPEIRRAAEWVAGQLHGLGMQNVQIMPTAGHPVVYGELLTAGEDKPTVLIYGHYDVQPAEPLELWDSPAFEPTQRGEYLFGRGASDMKAQVVITLKAVEALIRNGGLPVNIKFLVEGEEEIGSPNLGPFLVANRDLFTCDFALNPDTGMIGAQTPTITYGLRGLAYFEIRLTGPRQDLHSGQFGGAVHNPAQVLCELVAGMHDAQGRVTLPGFYDRVRPLEAEERAELARLPVSDETYLEETGAPALFGEVGYSALERVATRPTLEVNGLYSGYIGEGSKTVLPARSMAKISMRLVPDQKSSDMEQQLRQYLQARAPKSVTWELIKHAAGDPSVTDRRLPGVLALSRALGETWGIRPVYRREGGSVPVTAQMHDLLGVESVLTGFGLPDDNLHAPNEKMHLPTFYRGIQAITRFFSILGES